MVARTGGRVQRGDRLPPGAGTTRRGSAHGSVGRDGTGRLHGESDVVIAVYGDGRPVVIPLGP